MKKKTTSEIREELRKNMSKMFEKKYEIEMKSLENFKQLYHKTLEEKAKIAHDYSEVITKYEELKDKVAQYEDWITRLQEFMDMEPEAREKAIQKFKTEKALNEHMNDIFNFYDRFTSILF